MSASNWSLPILHIRYSLGRSNMQETAAYIGTVCSENCESRDGRDSLPACRDI